MKHHHNSKFDTSVEEEICRLYSSSNEYGSVALSKKYSCSYSTIINILRRNGIEVRDSSSSQSGLRTGKKGNHPTFKGGNVSTSGYRRIWINGESCLEHRYVLEQSIGRKLSSKEVVHHRDGNKLNNELSNLELMTRAQHAIHHECWNNLP